MANKENTSDEGLRVSYDVKTYHEQKYIDYTLRLREILKTLPSFAKDYFRAIERHPLTHEFPTHTIFVCFSVF